ncbi:hypothetical protein INT48_004616 [Thamnidium elegans]|uniref:Coiled-coil SMC6 And NSE5 INteracting (CANIN) domain-containing protein n=1 Tax=Thamnidium elegans TaxID=101142 RepID=A0A8H7W3E7_9FUNG|nr:hypothetical protein INT48_004616 [Thamnidium elegans]
MSSVLKKPARRSRKRLIQRTSDDEQENKPFLVLKKQCTERKENAKKLATLFDQLNQTRQELEQKGHYNVEKKKPLELEPIDLQKITFDDNFMLDTDQSSDDEDLDLINVAKNHLDQEAQDKIEDALVETLQAEQEGREQKEIHMSELSATSNGRSFLLSTGCIKDWHRSGWVCPNYIYQWLFEVVALESNKMTAKNALSTLFALWALPGTKIDTKLPHIYKQRYIQLDTFKSILLAYDAIPSQLVEGVLCPKTHQRKEQQEQSFNLKTSRHIPLSQFGWMIKAFSFSVRLWSKAYTSYEIRHIIRLLLQISIDKTGFLAVQDIQTAIDNCLSAIRESTWETEIKMITNDVCDIVSSTKRQVHLLDSVKTNYERSRYLRRMIGVTCLERCLEHEVPNSIDYISTDQTLIRQIHQIFSHPKGFFMCREDIDYEEVCIRVSMLDAAIGIDDDEIQRDKDIVLQMAEELRNIGLGIGARLGVIKKTLANEMIQRVWSRISYVVVGDLGTGKTSIIRRYVHNIFSSNYKSTIGVDFALKVIQWGPDLIVRLQLWDIAGQERFGNMTRVYYKEALGAIVVYDITRPQTFEGVTKWKKDIDTKVALPDAWGGGQIPVILLANKTDLIGEGHGQHVNPTELDQFCNENGFLTWFETSAKDNSNIEEATRHLISAILKLEEENADNIVNEDNNLHLNQQQQQQNNGCC